MFEIIFEDQDTLDQRREQMLDLLQENVCAVTFAKVDGEVRVMPCTLAPALLPRIEKEPAVARSQNADVMSVWCTDKAGWRSFRVANVHSIRVLDAK